MNNPKIGNQGTVPELPPAQIAVGLLQQDFPYQENVDGIHPLNLDYFIPVNCQTVKTARLSFRLRLYRTYSNFTASGTGVDATNATPAADATGESGHSHSHNHTWGSWSSNTGDQTSFSNWTDGAGTFFILAMTAHPPDTLITNTNAAGSSGHSHNHTHGAHNHSHSHSIAGATGLAVQEDVNNNPSVTVQFDGVDQTANLLPAGPYTTDQVEIDVTKFISTKLDRAWHTISLSPSVRARIQVVLRVLYNSNQV